MAIHTVAEVAICGPKLIVHISVQHISAINKETKWKNALRSNNIAMGAS